MFICNAIGVAQNSSMFQTAQSWIITVFFNQEFWLLLTQNPQQQQKDSLDRTFSEQYLLIPYILFYYR